MPLRPNMEPSEFIGILQRRRWLVIFSFLIIFFLALVYCVLVPDQYQSQIKILIIPPAVAEGMVRSTVNISTRDRLRTIEQDTISRTSLLNVIDTIGIQRLGFERMTEDEMMSRMRSRIELDIEKNPDRNPDRNVNTFVLSFLHENPMVAQKVASRLGALFIGENIKLREAVTQETSRFLETQLEETRVRLEQQEVKIKNYKLQYGGQLPQQEQANLSRLQRMQDQIKNNNDSIGRLQDRKAFLESQIAMIAKNNQGVEGTNPSGDDAIVPVSMLVDLAARQKKLEEVSRKFTDMHPAVVQARWEVQQAEAAVEEARKEADKNSRKGSAVPGTQRMDPGITEVQRLRNLVQQADLEINALKRENANAVHTIETIQAKVDAVPQREQEMVSLMRDYENIKKSYNDLLDKKLKANISKNLEEGQKGERFQVVEPADLPGRPAKPDRLRVILVALMASIVVGIGGAFGLEALDPTLRGGKEFRSYFDIPILASLPVIHDDNYNRKAAFRSAAIKGGIISIAGAYLLFLVIHGDRVLFIMRNIVASIGGK